MLLAMSSILMNQQYIIYQIKSLQTETHIRLCTDKNVVTRGLKESNLVFSLEAVFQYLLILCLSQLYGP